METLAIFMQKIMKNSSNCEHCIHRRLNADGEPYCFFAYACLTKDFYFLDEGDD
jgi:hypothetical protein